MDDMRNFIFALVGFVIGAMIYDMFVKKYIVASAGGGSSSAGGTPSPPPVETKPVFPPVTAGGVSYI
jgi:hypothetical protein